MFTAVNVCNRFLISLKAVACWHHSEAPDRSRVFHFFFNFFFLVKTASLIFHRPDLLWKRYVNAQRRLASLKARLKILRIWIFQFSEGSWIMSNFHQVRRRKNLAQKCFKLLSPRLSFASDKKLSLQTEMPNRKRIPDEHKKCEKLNFFWWKFKQGKW